MFNCSWRICTEIVKIIFKRMKSQTGSKRAFPTYHFLPIEGIMATDVARNRNNTTECSTVTFSRDKGYF